jgi:signal transduction histidine kinase
MQALALPPPHDPAAGGSGWSWAARLAWLPLPALLLLQAGLWAFGASKGHASHLQLLIFHLLFLGMINLLVSASLGKAFLRYGEPGFLLFSSGLLVWGSAALIASALTGATANVRMTVHNLGIWAAAGAMLAAAVLFLRPRRPLARPGWWLLGGYATALGGVTWITVAVLGGWTPRFYSPDGGWTLVRETVLASAATTLAVTTLVLLALHRRTGSAFARWSGLGLGFVALGLTAVLFQPYPGSPLGWSGRLSQVLGAFYLLVAVRANQVQGEPPLISLETTLRDRRLQYAVAVLAAATATCGRLALLQTLGRQNIYITFYPAVMIAALYGGTGPGLLATGLSMVLANRFWGQQAASGHPAPGEWLSIGLFGLGCSLICIIAGAMHRAQDAVAQGKATAAAAAERAAAAEALSRTVAELTRSNRDLEQFAYVASHDLQEPLRMVKTYVSLLRDRYQGRLDPKADQYIAFAVEGASRMQTLIRDLLDYSRFSSGPREVRWVNLEEPLERALAGLHAAIQDSGATLTRDPLPSVPGDPAQLTALFQNLLGNAIKFHSDRTPEIHIGVRHQDGRQVFAVSDNGIGLDPHSAERIFDIFHRLHGRGSYPGNGIGLAICKKIVERHGGLIWAEPRPGGGTSFHFTLPGAPS